MRLQRLTGLERQKIVDEFEEMLKLIAKLQGILASEALQLSIVVEELEKVQTQFGNPRRTEIVPTTERDHPRGPDRGRRHGDHGQHDRLHQAHAAGRPTRRNGAAARAASA